MSMGRIPVGSEIPVTPGCIMSIDAVGRVTQECIEKLIAYLQLIKGSFPQDGEDTMRTRGERDRAQSTDSHSELYRCESVSVRCGETSQDI
jgi:hypothetical protein